MAIDYLKQEQESDMNLIARLAKEHSADGTVKNGKLVFKEKSIPTKVQDISPSDLIDFRLTWTDKPVYNRVIATWHDRTANAAHEEIWNGKDFVADKTGDVSHVKQQTNSKEEARKQAKTHWHKLHAMQLKAAMKMEGNPRITSKLGLRLQGFIQESQGTVLFIKSVRHEIRGAYTTHLDAGNQSASSTTV